MNTHTKIAVALMILAYIPVCLGWTLASCILIVSSLLLQWRAPMDDDGTP